MDLGGRSPGGVKGGGRTPQGEGAGNHPYIYRNKTWNNPTRKTNLQKILTINFSICSPPGWKLYGCAHEMFCSVHLRESIYI